MFKLVSHRFSVFALSFVLLLNALIGYPNVAHAGKTKSFALDPSSKVVNVVAIYETSLEAQEDVIDALKASKSIKKAPGFNGFSILKSEDGDRVVALSQWQDLESYEAYNATPVEESKSAKDKKKKDIVAIAPTRTMVFEIEKAQAMKDGIIPTIRGKEAVVQLSDFSLKSPDDQTTVLASVEKTIPGVLQQQPTPQSVILMKSTDSKDVALLANWNCGAEFEDLGKPAAFEQPSDVASLADNDQHLYDVVKIISADKKFKGSKGKSDD